MTTCLGIDVGLRNLSYCLLKYENGQYEIKDWKLIDVLSLCGQPDRSCNTLSSQEIHNISEYLLKRIFSPFFIRENKIAHISIERQPGGRFSNSRTILFSHLIYEYFRQCLRNVKWGDTLQTSCFVGAQQKYKQKWLSLFNIKTSANYKKRKNNSVFLCCNLCKDLKIQGFNEEQFRNEDKNDDLADAFLLALTVWDHWI